MPFLFHERPTSGESTSNPPTHTTKWVASGSSDRAFVRAYATAATPAIVSTVQGTLHRQDLRIDPAGADIFYVTVPYGQYKKVVGQYRLSFSTTGGTLHITNSKATIQRYAVTGSATDHKGAIGVHGDEVDGCDIIVPALRITAHFRHPYAMVTLARIKDLARYTGSVNSDTFLTFAPGEVLFYGADGNEGTDVETDVAYSFIMSQNATGLTIGDIMSVAKKGHEYLWIEYTSAEDAGKPARRPKFVHVERVYDTINMSLSLGFGA